MKTIHPAIAEHAMEENERLRGLLAQALEFTEANTCDGPDVAQLIAEMRAALSQQAEPVRSPRTEDTASMDSNSEQEQFTAVDMATAAAQGFRDGQAAVEQAPAQDEREAYSKWRISMEPYGFNGVDAFSAGATWQRTRPAQTEQQPISRDAIRAVFLRNGFTVKEGQADLKPYVYAAAEELLRLNAAPIAQTVPQDTTSDQHRAELYDEVWGRARSMGYVNVTDALIGLERMKAAPQPEQSGKFAMHQRVRKTSGSEWQGRICGTYSTALTPEGYAVESEAHAGSVQIYPAKALELVPMAAKEA